MLLQNKMAELLSFSNKQSEDLRKFISKWEKELRSELGLSLVPGGTVRLSFMPDVELSRIPDARQVQQGMHVGPAGEKVEVLGQDHTSGLIALEITEPEHENERFQSISPALFKRLFTYVPPDTTMAVQSLSFHTEQDSEVEAARREQVNAWHRSFSADSVTEDYEFFREKLEQLDLSLNKENLDAAKSEYLESFFLFYILGARLGFSGDQNFQKLHRTVFDMIDRDPESAQRTQDFYANQLIDTRCREIKVYDPANMLAPPESYFITFSTCRQRMQNGEEIPEGGFLPPSRPN